MSTDIRDELDWIRFRLGWLCEIRWLASLNRDETEEFRRLSQRERELLARN